MDSKTYLENAMKTDLRDKYEPVQGRVSTKRNARLLHALLGLSGEVGELQDQLKRHLVYGKELDVVNIKEETGDCLWYMALLLDEIGSSFEEVMSLNIAKLRKRYPDGFTEEKAVNRDVAAERELLESETNFLKAVQAFDQRVQHNRATLEDKK